MSDPFKTVEGVTVEFVDSAAGSRKTLAAVAVSLQRARTEGIKTLFVMPTLALIEEMVETARRQSDVPVVEITSRDDQENTKSGHPRKLTTTALVYRHITGKDEKGRPIDGHLTGAHLLFITHETFFRMGNSWPKGNSRVRAHY